MTDSLRATKSLNILLIAVVMLVAIGLRAWDWPARYDVRDVDEVGYLSSSLCLVEGITPGYKPSPAGPQIWLGWLWGEAHLVQAELHPYPAARAQPIGLRAFMAADRALFDQYRDLSAMRQFILAFNVILSILGVAAGIAYGWRFGGMLGAVLVGGLLATCPLLVDYADQARPYAMGWSFAVIALWAASRTPAPRKTPPWFWTAILMGLAIGSRIELLLMFPLLWWTWAQRPATGRQRIINLLLLTGGALLTAYIVAPWLLTGLPGNLRAIVTIQLANPRSATVAHGAILRDFAYGNGLGLLLVLFLAGAICFQWREPGRVRNIVLALLVILLTATIFKSTGFGLHQSGAAVLTLILGSAVTVGIASRRQPKIAAGAVALVVLFPLARSLMSLRSTARRPAIAAADWVQSHVPAGAAVYTHHYLLKVPLPTSAAADRIWGEVTALDAGSRKLASGMKRFGLASAHLPRVMSEENLVQERGNERRFYILGDDVGETGPRYDLRLIKPSPVFGEQDVAGDFSRTGGVVLWRPDEDGPPPVALGTATSQLHNADGESTVLVFCSPELRAVVGGAAPTTRP